MSKAVGTVVLRLCGANRVPACKSCCRGNCQDVDLADGSGRQRPEGWSDGQLISVRQVMHCLETIESYIIAETYKKSFYSISFPCIIDCD